MGWWPPWPLGHLHSSCESWAAGTQSCCSGGRVEGSMALWAPSWGRQSEIFRGQKKAKFPLPLLSCRWGGRINTLQVKQSSLGKVLGRKQKMLPANGRAFCYLSTWLVLRTAGNWHGQTGRGQDHFSEQQVHVQGLDKRWNIWRGVPFSLCPVIFVCLEPWKCSIKCLLNNLLLVPFHSSILIDCLLHWCCI